MKNIKKIISTLFMLTLISISSCSSVNDEAKEFNGTYSFIVALLSVQPDYDNPIKGVAKLSQSDNKDYELTGEEANKLIAPYKEVTFNYKVPFKKGVYKDNRIFIDRKNAISVEVFYLLKGNSKEDFKDTFYVYSDGRLGYINLTGSVFYYSKEKAVDYKEIYDYLTLKDK